MEEALEAAPVLEDARLVTTELVNNAVLHSGCTPDDIISVVAQLEDEFLVIAVHDPGVAPQLPGALPLRVVSALAHRWGIERPDGRRLWAALPVSTG
jgi:hypothetical protein